MQIEERVVNDVTILDLKGKITLGDGDEVLKDKINSLVLQNRRRISLTFPTSTAQVLARSSAPTRP
jgi:hypothetical protein